MGAPMHAIHTHLRGRIPAGGARRRAEEGPLWDLTPQTRKGIGVYAPMIGSTVASPHAGPLLRVAPIPAPRCGAPAFLATTLRDGAIFAHFGVDLLCNIDILLQSFS